MVEVPRIRKSQEVAHHVAALKAVGLSVHHVRNPMTVRSWLTAIGATENDPEGGVPYNTRWLDPLRNQFTADRLSWLFLIDADEKPVAKIGNRLDRLGDESYLDFAKLGVMSVHERQKELPPDSRFPEIMKKIRGNVVYSGDLFLDRTHSGRGVVGHLMKLNYWLCIDCWPNLNWAVNYVRELDAKRFSWTAAHWTLVEDTVDYSYPPNDQFRGHRFGCADRQMFIRMLLDHSYLAHGSEEYAPCQAVSSKHGLQQA